MQEPVLVDTIKQQQEQQHQPRIITGQDPRSIFKPLEKLGVGAYATVLKAHHLVNNNMYAIKIISTAKLNYKDSERLKREVSIVSILSHPHIAKVYEIYHVPERKQTYIVQELLGGGDFLDYIAKYGPLPEYEASYLLRGVIEATHYLHSMGYAHRDLKPENLVLDSEHKLLKLIDFGFAKSKNDMYGLETPIGTPGWQANDVMKGEPYSLAVDMWSIGCIVYFALFAVPPFSSQKNLLQEKVDELNQLVKIGVYVWPSNVEISIEAKDFISNLLEKDPNARMTAGQALEHPWMKPKSSTTPAPVSSNNPPSTTRTDSSEAKPDSNASSSSSSSGPLSSDPNPSPGSGRIEHQLNPHEKDRLRQSINIVIDHARERAEEKAQKEADDDLQGLQIGPDVNLEKY